MKKMIIIAATLTLCWGQVQAAEFGDLAVGAAEVKAAGGAAQITPATAPSEARAPIPYGLGHKYLKFMDDFDNAYVNRLISYNHYRLSKAAVGYAERWSFERMDLSLDLAAGVLHERTGDVLYHSWPDKSAAAHSGPKAAGAESAKAQQYPPELVARVYRFYDVLTNAYINRLITQNHFHLTDTAIMNAQKYGPGALEYTLDLSEGFLKESLSAREWAAIGGSVTPKTDPQNK